MKGLDGMRQQVGSAGERTANEIKQRAQEAAARQDWTAAERLWGQCIEEFPADAKPGWYAGQAAALRKLGRHDEADALAAVMRQRWQNNPLGWTGAAFGAAARKDWPGAEQWWRECIARFPDSTAVNWYVSMAYVLQQQGRAAEARETCRTAQLRFPGSPDGWIGEARASTAWPRIAVAWEIAADKDQLPATVKHLQQAYRAFIRAGRFVDAARIVGKLKHAEPDQNHWLIAGLDLLVAQGDARGTIAYLLQHEALPQFRQTFPTDQLARLASEAGHAPTEAITLLARWMSREDAARAVDQVYAQESGTFGQVMDAVIELRNRRRPVTFRQKAAACRKWAKIFLGNRTHRNFLHLAETAVEIAGVPRINALQSITARLFPLSPARLKIDMFVKRGTGGTEDIALASGWRAALPQPENSIADQLKAMPKRRLVCAVMVRDEAEMLPHFISHYMELGVRHFLVIDNGSVDRLGGIRAGASGADIVVIDAPYSFARNRCGMTWINEICEADVCDWLLFADADEHLIFPGCEAGEIDNLIDHFDSRGETAMPAFMLDLYDDSYRSRGVPSDDIKEHNTFYATHTFHPYLWPPYINVTGGVRFAEYHPLMLVKVPLLRSSAVRMTNNHHATPCIPAQTSGIMLHYKIFRDRQLLDESPEAVAGHSRVRDRPAADIRRHIELSSRDSGLRPSGPFHLTYSGSRQLLGLGYLSADEVWRQRLSGRWPRRCQRKTDPSKTNFVQELEYDALLKTLASTTAAGQRHAIRTLLNDNLPRIGSGAVRLGILLLVAAGLGRERSPDRIAGALIRKIAAGLTAEDCSHLEPILTSPLLTNHKSISLKILEAIAASGMLNSRLAIVHAQLLAYLGRSEAAIAVLKRANVDAADIEARQRLALSRNLRDWPAFYDTLSEIIDGQKFPSVQSLLHSVHSCPNPAVRERFLDQLRQYLEARLPELSPSDASALLAILHAMKRQTECLEIYEQVQLRLPKNSSLFFGRLLGMDPEWAGTKSVWCLGMSKTGTTSLHHYAERLGFFSGHFFNTITGELLNGTDAALFDIASDSSLLFHAVRNGIDPNRRILVTTRESESWQRSALIHFAREVRAPAQTFEAIRETFYNGQAFPFGQGWFDVHEELYFRHESLEMAYEYHCDWIATLEKRLIAPILRLPLEFDNKAELLSHFLGENLPVLDYPHTNPGADPNEW